MAANITITDLDKITPLGEVVALIKYQNGVETEIKLTVRIDTPYEMENFVNGGVLNLVVEQFSAK